MLPLSDFLKLHKPTVIKFVDDISNLNELSEAQVIRINDFYEEAGTRTNGPSADKNKATDFKEIHVQFENAACKYLAILNRLLNTHVPQMKAYLEAASSEDKDETNDQSEKPKTDDSSFLLSLQRLITILTGINGPSKSQWPSQKIRECLFSISLVLWGTRVLMANTKWYITCKFKKDNHFFFIFKSNFSWIIFLNKNWTCIYI